MNGTNRWNGSRLAALGVAVSMGCPEGSQPCGDWCQPPCPEFYFCLTGCCQKNPS
jgi:hypothetical protein